MTETTTITVPRIRDGDGQPTCCWWKQTCPFMMHSRFGTVKHCYWNSERLLQRREHGKGTTVPHATCPVWNGEVQA